MTAYDQYVNIDQRFNDGDCHLACNSTVQLLLVHSIHCDSVSRLKSDKTII